VGTGVVLAAGIMVGTGLVKVHRERREEGAREFQRHTFFYEVLATCQHAKGRRSVECGEGVKIP
jgi:hypothetical protein